MSELWKVLGAHEVRDVTDVPQDRLVSGIVVAQEDPHAVDADNAARCGAGLDLFVADVALVVPYGGRVCV